MEKLERGTGTLLHITSLPSQYGIGSLGKEAKNFIDWLSTSGQIYWQILPINDLNNNVDNSPYRACSSHAGYPLLIDLDDLVDKGLLKLEELDMEWYSNHNLDIVDFELVRKNKFKLLEKAFNRFDMENTDFIQFINLNENWLPKYSLYKVYRESIENKKFVDMSSITEETICIIKDTKEFKFNMFLQYLFFQQWGEIKSYANSKGIKIIGDLPMFMDFDSVEVWSNPQYFNFDEVSGYPGDNTLHGSQVWGHPTYNWKVLKEDNYTWWMERFKFNALQYDIIRVDHFLGFDRYWAISNKPNTYIGQWKTSVEDSFFDMMDDVLAHTPIIAETIGIETERSKAIVRKHSYNETKIIQWCSVFGEPEVHTYKNTSVVYTGTHDTNTLKTWGETFDHTRGSYVYDYFNSGEDTLNWNVIKSLLKSNANTVILNMQDILELDDKSRFNTPGVNQNQWRWKLKNGQLTIELAMKLKHLNLMFGRVDIRIY